MKKSRLISLLLLYAAILISIICLQTYAFGNLEMRSFVNWCSIIIGAAGGVIFWLLLRHNGTALPKEKEKKVRQKINWKKEMKL